MWDLKEAVDLSNQSYYNEQAFITKDRCKIAFKGTSESRLFPKFLRDIITNINIIPYYTLATGMIPRGFYNLAAENIENVIRGLEEEKALFLTGHSLGGAVALVTACLLKARGYDVRSVYCFGAPRVGKLEILENVEVRLYKNGNDFVTNLPWFYTHARPLIHIGKSDNAYLDHTISNYKHFINTLGD